MFCPHPSRPAARPVRPPVRCVPPDASFPLSRGAFRRYRGTDLARPRFLVPPSGVLRARLLTPAGRHPMGERAGRRIPRRRRARPAARRQCSGPASARCLPLGRGARVPVACGHDHPGTACARAYWRSPHDLCGLTAPRPDGASARPVIGTNGVAARRVRARESAGFLQSDGPQSRPRRDSVVDGCRQNW